ncbi:MAG TPA: UDP-3-O-(3-hydroxymyristoyl)glucosamine N-acyltransferase [Candidatus Limnocylindrales bacterium]|nr:UDP-3-O-(3-hydroxymyristoyl)glucosamine N-acyltransferase [Candidatus Limnocylindrales bacterium]
MKLGQIASTLGATLENGDPETEITGVSGIEEAVAGQITFVANPKYFAAAKNTSASAIIVSEDFPSVACVLLRSQNPYLCFARAIDLFYQSPRYKSGIHPTAVIAPTARIGSNAHIGAYVVIDDGVELGDDSVLLPHVVIYRGAKIGSNFLAHAHSIVREDCRIGDNVILQNGAIVGCDGFGFARDGDHWEKISQSGPTVIESDVEVQANACIDRASVGETRIARGVKIDNLTQVGHGAAVGEHTLLCAQVGLAGSTVVGKNVIIAGQAGVAGHCNVGDGVVITAQSGTHGDIPAGSMVSGSPAFEHKQWLRAVNAFSKLPEMAKAVRNLTQKQSNAAAGKNEE